MNTSGFAVGVTTGTLAPDTSGLNVNTTEVESTSPVILFRTDASIS
jgi:hypothetical protein